jgi:hypothetical protein
VTSEIREGNLSRSMTMVGHIDDYVDDPCARCDERVHGKGIKLFLSAARDKAWTDALSQREGLPSICGVATVEANVTPKIYEWDGETVEDQPVQIRFSLSDEAFNAIKQQAEHAQRRSHSLEMEAELAGNSLPDGGIFGIVELKDLDVSGARVFAVNMVSFTQTKFPNRLRGRVLPILPLADEGYGAILTILLTQASYDLDVARGEVSSISCEGRVIHGGGNGADVTVEFREYERSRVTQELPAHALAGEFLYYPRRSDEEYSSTHFSIALKHLPEDARELLLPVLASDAGTEIVLVVSLVVEKDVLVAATESLGGEVRSYSFRVRRSFAEPRLE